MQRPLHVPGLVVVEALVSTSPGKPWVCMQVELFMYPGNGKLIVTGGPVRKSFNRFLTQLIVFKVQRFVDMM